VKEANRVFEGKVDRGSTPYEYEYWKRVVAKHQQGLPDVLYVRQLRQITLGMGPASGAHVWCHMSCRVPCANRKVNNSWWVNDAVKKVVLSPAIGEAAAKLLRTNEIRLWHDQVIAKPGLGPDGHNEKAGNIGWHQVRRSAPAPSLPHNRAHARRARRTMGSGKSPTTRR